MLVHQLNGVKLVDKNPIRIIFFNGFVKPQNADYDDGKYYLRCFMFLWSGLVTLATMVIINLTRLFLVFKVLNFEDGGQHGVRGVAGDDDAGHHGQ